MIDRIKTHIPRYVAAAAAALVAFAFLLGGRTTAVGAAAGGLVAVLDAWVLVWLVVRVVDGASFVRRSFAAILLGTKLFALLGVCWVLLDRVGVDPLGFSLGLGALVVGMLIGGLELSAKEARAASDAGPTAMGEG